VTTQIIVYSTATGRVRRVVDPQKIVTNVIAFVAQAGAQAGESTLVYNNTGTGNLSAWQAAVNAKTLKTPTGDRYCIIDAGNNIVGVCFADPLCGDAVPGCTLVQHDTAGPGWTYSGTTFTPPLVTAVPRVLV
jgi:hypothetical protein